MDSFYISLPSNDTSYDDNKTSRFTCRLPETLELDNSWTVALSSIIYPISFRTLGSEDEQFIDIYYKDENENMQKLRIKIPGITFKSIDELEKQLNEILRKYFHNIDENNWKSGNRNKRSTDKVLQPIEESEEVREKVRQLQQKKKDEKNSKNDTLLGAAKRAVDKAVQDSQNERRRILGFYDEANRRVQLLKERTSANKDQRILNKLPMLENIINILLEYKNSAENLYEDVLRAQQETNNFSQSKNVNQARKAADIAKEKYNTIREILKNLGDKYREMDEIIEEVYSINANPPPVAENQETTLKELTPIIEDQSVIDQVEALKKAKVIPPNNGQTTIPTPLPTTPQPPKGQQDSFKNEKIEKEQSVSNDLPIPAQPQPSSLVQLSEISEPKLPIPSIESLIIPFLPSPPSPPKELHKFDDEEEDEDIVLFEEPAIPVNPPAKEDRFKEMIEKDPAYKIIFFYDETLQKFTIYFQEKIMNIKLSQELTYVLGYDNQFIKSAQTAKFMPNLSGSIRQLYIYSPIVEQSIVGNQKAPLLRVVNIVGEVGQVQEAIYSTEFHYKLQTKRISEITIEIRTVTGKLAPFEWGNTFIVLHFKRSLFV